MVEANNKFAFDMYEKIAKGRKGNIFFSPYSVSSAMAMVYEGAKGKTKDEIKEVFNFSEYSVLRSNYAAIYNNINKEEKQYELRTGNALWVERDYSLIKEYMDIVEKYYGGKAANVDFIKEPARSVNTINEFIKEQTEGKIKDILSAGDVNPLTKLIITNAIYFKGMWEFEFDKKLTKEEEFRITANEKIVTPMMHMKTGGKIFNYADLGDSQILELPYKNGEISMLILLPADDIESIEKILTNKKIAEYKTAMEKTELDAIAMPKFEFDAKYFMNDALAFMGMKTAFTDNADFSGMSKGDLLISDVIHQVYIKVDETGTEATAATATGVAEWALPLRRTVFRADHPFIFIIEEKMTGDILFMGKVMYPNESGIISQIKDVSEYGVKDEEAIYRNNKYGYEISYPTDWFYSVGAMTPESEGFTITSPVIDNHADNRIIVTALSEDLAKNIFEDDILKKIKSRSDVIINSI